MIGRPRYVVPIVSCLTILGYCARAGRTARGTAPCRRRDRVVAGPDGPSASSARVRDRTARARAILARWRCAAVRPARSLTTFGPMHVELLDLAGGARRSRRADLAAPLRHVEAGHAPATSGSRRAPSRDSAFTSRPSGRRRDKRQRGERRNHGAQRASAHPLSLLSPRDLCVGRCAHAPPLAGHPSSGCPATQAGTVSAAGTAWTCASGRCVRRAGHALEAEPEVQRVAWSCDGALLVGALGPDPVVAVEGAGRCARHRQAPIPASNDSVSVVAPRVTVTSSSRMPGISPNDQSEISEIETSTCCPANWLRSTCHGS